MIYFMKLFVFTSFLFTLSLCQITYSNVVGSQVHPDKKKFSKTPVADTLQHSDFYVGSQFDYDRDGIPDKIEINGISKYKYVKGLFTWSQAKSDAEYRGGMLASITKETENKKISKILENKKAWIGGNDNDFEGRWNWVSGEPFKFENWAKNRPIRNSNSEDFLEIQKDGKWNDTLKTNKQGYILETKIKTNPNLADSDGDGYSDLVEIKANSDPRDRQSKPYDKKK